MQLGLKSTFWFGEADHTKKRNEIPEILISLIGKLSPTTWNLIGTSCITIEISPNVPIDPEPIPGLRLLRQMCPSLQFSAGWFYSIQVVVLDRGGWWSSGVPVARLRRWLRRLMGV